MMNRKRVWIEVGMAAGCLLAVLCLPAPTAHAAKMAVTQFFSPLLSAATHTRRAVALPHAESAPQPQQMLRESEELKLENDRLRDQLGLARRSPWKMLSARVIGRDASNWWKTITLDRGSAAGVRVDMAVVVPAGLVGKTIEVGDHVSRVLLIADPNCKVSALLQQTREPGIVEGVGASGETRPRCQMNFIHREAKIQIGDWVLASGLGTVFPKGAVVGQVESVSLTGLYQTARVTPAADLARLEEVLIVLSEK